jgi:hypothetical protein
LRLEAAGYAVACALVIGCYQSREVRCLDVPESERCDEPPPGVDADDLSWTGLSFLHRDPEESCIAVSFDPAMEEYQGTLERSLALVGTATCAPCFLPPERLATEAIPPGPRIHLAPDGTCSNSSGVWGCLPDLDLCRGTHAIAVLSLSENNEPPFDDWSVQLMTAGILATFGTGRVNTGEVVDGLSDRVDSMLCVVYDVTDPWCPPF